MHAILSWPSLLRPPLPDQEPPVAPEMRIPLRALACRNQVTSLTALVTSDEPVPAARLAVSDLVCESGVIRGDDALVRLVGAVPTPEAGPVCDALYEVDEFFIDKSAALAIRVTIPEDAPAGTYRGRVSLVIDGNKVAENDVEIEVASVILPDVRDWAFYLCVWLNPSAVAQRYGAQTWSDRHFELLRPYVEDQALHGQKTVMVPVCYQPWGTQTYVPYASTVRWIKRGDSFDFDFSVFDRYVELHESCGVDGTIHCYSVVQGPGDTDQSVIKYHDPSAGTDRLLVTKVGSKDHSRAWTAFLSAFQSHLRQKGWLHKSYMGFDEKPTDMMIKIIDFLQEHAPDMKIALGGNTGKELSSRLDDLGILASFDSRGIVETVPPERRSMGMAEFLGRDRASDSRPRHSDNPISTFYNCCEPDFPNTYLYSPLVESRMLPYLAAQGGYDGFLRYSYNDWPEDPFTNPKWANWPSGDTFYVYPGEHGPISSLRWEQLREGILDYELAMIASANIQGTDEMVDYEQAISLACRNPDGRTKSIGDIEIARRLLIPIAAHQQE